MCSRFSASLFAGGGGYLNPNGPTFFSFCIISLFWLLPPPLTKMLSTHLNGIHFRIKSILEPRVIGKRNSYSYKIGINGNRVFSGMPVIGIPNCYPMDTEKFGILI